MTTTRAFELREGIDADLFGGSATLPDGSSFDIGEALADNNGVIVSDDEGIVNALDAHPALKRAAVPEGQRGYDGMTVPELRAEIDQRNEGRDDDDVIEVATDARKEVLISALANDDDEGNR